MAERRRTDQRISHQLERHLREISWGGLQTCTPQELLEVTTHKGRRREPLVVEDRNQLVAAVTGELRPGVYIEMGTGNNSYAFTTRRTFTPQSPYIGMGVTYDSKSHHPSWNVNVDLQGRSENIITGEAQEVFMGNVSFSSKDLGPLLHLELLQEAKRFLDPDTGILVLAINDTFSPPQRFGTLGFLLEHAGFGRRMYLDNSDPSFDQVQETFGWYGDENTMEGTGILDPNCQYIIAQQGSLSGERSSRFPRGLISSWTSRG